MEAQITNPAISFAEMPLQAGQIRNRLEHIIQHKAGSVHN